MKARQLTFFSEWSSMADSIFPSMTDALLLCLMSIVSVLIGAPPSIGCAHWSTPSSCVPIRAPPFIRCSHQITPFHQIFLSYYPLPLGVLIGAPSFIGCPHPSMPFHRLCLSEGPLPSGVPLGTPPSTRYSHQSAPSERRLPSGVIIAGTPFDWVSPWECPLPLNIPIKAPLSIKCHWSSTSRTPRSIGYSLRTTLLHLSTSFHRIPSWQRCLPSGVPIRETLVPFSSLSRWMVGAGYKSKQKSCASTSCNAGIDTQIT